ncbi:hypothetical protein VTN77DRAFT_4139 [Rasamsonia byssochlamydoides]|uniref:uncharacterized protein n=1 Tax=Rasamsonia byssochlamydoides TaxID=89139 RepID=UPI0037443278
MAEPTLEGIPVELRILILVSVSDLKTLSNLVHASPACRQAYVLVRQEILHRFVGQQYGCVDIAEAIAAIRSEGLHAEVESNKKKKLDFLLQDYGLTMPSPPWMGSMRWESEILPLRLSDDERARLLRALYRLQTYCNIFGTQEYLPQENQSLETKLSSSNWCGVTFEIEEMWSLFFGTMPPWEVEEFACVWIYARNKYTQIFEEIAEDVTTNGARFKWLPLGSLPIECKELHPYDDHYEPYRNHLVSIGPCFLYEVLRQESYEKRWDVVASNALPYQNSFMDFIKLSLYPGPLIYPADRCEREDVASLLPALPPLERPNMGWIRYWYGSDPMDNVRRAEIFDHSPVIEEDWELGYVFWDAFETYIRDCVIATES